MIAVASISGIASLNWGHGAAALQHMRPLPFFAASQKITDAELELLRTREVGYSLQRIRVCPLDSKLSESKAEYAAQRSGAAHACTFISSPMLLLPAPVPPRAAYVGTIKLGAQGGLAAAAPQYLAWLEDVCLAAPATSVDQGAYSNTAANALAKLIAASMFVAVNVLLMNL
jgi:hypothetical protein